MGKLADELRERSKLDDAMIVGSEIRAALGELTAEGKLHRTRILAANEVLRSAMEIASRKGADTRWLPFKGRLKLILESQHKYLYPAPASGRQEHEPWDSVIGPDEECTTCGGVGHNGTCPECHHPYPADSRQTSFTKGEYVLASKYNDGDPGDQWAVGFFDSMWDDRYIVVDGDGQRLRYSGFRRCETVSTEVGEWLVLHGKEFSDANSDFGYDDDGKKYGRSVWDIAALVEKGQRNEPM